MGGSWQFAEEAEHRSLTVAALKRVIVDGWIEKT